MTLRNNGTPESQGDALRGLLLGVVSSEAIIQAGITLLESNASSKYISTQQTFILLQESSGH